MAPGVIMTLAPRFTLDKGCGAMGKSKDDYSEADAQRRFEQALKGAAKAPAKKKSKQSETKGRDNKKS